MGLVQQLIRFEGPSVPDIDRIAAAVTALCGLAVRIERPAEPSKLQELEAHLAFEAEPGNALEISAYRPGAVRKHIEASMPGDSDDARLFRRVMIPTLSGADETEEFRTVRLQMTMGQEETLLLVTALALESLGGKIQSQWPSDLRERMTRPLSPAELRRRSRAASARTWAAAAMIVLFLPFTMLWTVLHALLTFPAKRRRTERWLQQELERDKAERPPSE